MDTPKKKATKKKATKKKATKKKATKKKATKKKERGRADSVLDDPGWEALTREGSEDLYSRLDLAPGGPLANLALKAIRRERRARETLEAWEGRLAKAPRPLSCRRVYGEWLLERARYGARPGGLIGALALLLAPWASGDQETRSRKLAKALRQSLGEAAQRSDCVSDLRRLALDVVEGRQVAVDLALRRLRRAWALDEPRRFRVANDGVGLSIDGTPLEINDGKGTMSPLRLSRALGLALATVAGRKATTDDHRRLGDFRGKVEQQGISILKKLNATLSYHELGAVPDPSRPAGLRLHSTAGGPIEVTWRGEREP